MIIDVLCNDGSPLEVTEKTMRGENGRLGVGGAELALLTMCAAWQFYGNKVTLYNNPKELGASSFEQKNINDFNPKDDRDILIIFRSPNRRIDGAKGKKIWWSCDSYTIDDYREYRKHVDKVVCISPYHSKYFRDMYGIMDAINIDLPVRTWEYSKIPKIKNRCIFTSIPDRGLMELCDAWARIVKEIPTASLVITSDWRLWTEYATEENTRNFRLAYSKLPNVKYCGAIKRKDLVKIQSEADLHLYPSTFLEQFCIAVAESQVAGVYPITSDSGALSTTNMGLVLHGNPSDSDWQNTFVENTIRLLTDDKLADKQKWIHEVAKKRFSIENILNQWSEKVFDG